MNIKHLLQAIHLGSLKFEQLPKELFQAWVEVRFAGLAPHEINDAEKLGAMLMTSDNFGKLPSGLLDKHHVIFPADLLPRETEPITNHLEWMIDARRNPETIKPVLGAFNHSFIYLNMAKPLRTPALNKDAQIDLPWLAGYLAEMWTANAPLAAALLSGHLDQIREFAQAVPEDAQDETARCVRHMLLIWTAFNLQVMSAGAFKNPDLMTVASLHALIDQLYEMATLAMQAFSQSKDAVPLPAGTTKDGMKVAHTELNTKLDAFLQENDLWSHAQSTASSLGLSAADFQPGSLTQRNLEAYLQYLSEQMKVIVDAFDLHEKSYAPTLLQDSKNRSSTQKFKVSTVKKDGVRVLNTGASFHRNLMPPLTALCFAVRAMVEKLAVLPRDASILTLDPAKPAQVKVPLYKGHQKSTVVTQLIAVYRGLYARDDRHVDNMTAEDRAASVQKTLDKEAAGEPVYPLEELTISGKAGKQIGYGMEPQEILRHTAGSTVELGGRPPPRSFAEAGAILAREEELKGFGENHPGIDHVRRNFGSGHIDAVAGGVLPSEPKKSTVTPGKGKTIKKR